MIRKKNSKFKNSINTPEDYFSCKEYDKKVMFEKRKNNLIKQFFLFWSLIVILFACFAFYFHSLGILILVVPIFITYVRVSYNKEKWKENFDIVMSNDIAKIFAYINYSIFLIFIIIILYMFFKNNFKFDLVFMDKIIDFIYFILSKH